MLVVSLKSQGLKPQLESTLLRQEGATECTGFLSEADPANLPSARIEGT